MITAGIAAFALALAAQTPAAPPSEQSADDEIVVRAKPNKYWSAGVEAFKAGDYALAEKEFDVLAKRARGTTRLEVYLLQSFVSDFIFVIDRLPDDVAAVYYMRGAAQARQLKYDEAVGSFKEASRINPDFYDPYADLALVHILRGRPDLARRKLRPMAKLLTKCSYKCEEKRVRYDRVQELLDAPAATVG